MAHAGSTKPLPGIAVIAGGIARDLEDLLLPIGRHAEALGRESDLGEVRRRAAEIEHAARRAARLTQGLLAVCRRREPPSQTVDVNAALERILVPLRRLIPKAIEVQVEIAEDPIMACSDPGHLDQVLINLVLNARDALEGRGTLSLRTGALVLDEDHSDAGLLAGHYAYVVVADSGCGMSAETQTRIFDPSYTTKPEGTGLGLASVRAVVTAAGGGVRVESEPGRGSTFTIFLPYAGADAAESA